MGDLTEPTYSPTNSVDSVVSVLITIIICEISTKEWISLFLETIENYMLKWREFSYWPAEIYCYLKFNKL